MPHLEEQFPPVNPLLLQRPDALDPPDREEEERARPVENRVENEAPIPGSLANGIDRVTISANARVIVPIQPLEETVPLPVDLIPGESEVNPAVPELLDIEIQGRDAGAEAPAADEAIGTSLQNFLNVLETRRREEASSTRIGLNPIEPRSAPTLTPPTTPELTQPTAPGLAPASTPEQTPANPLVQNAARETREATASRIEDRIRTEPPPAPAAAPETPPANEVELELDEDAAPINENRFVPFAPPPRGPLSVEPDDVIVPDPAEAAPQADTLGIRGNTPIPRTEGRVNILTPPNVGEDPPGPNIQETRNFGQGRALSLDLETAGNENSFISLDTVDEVLEEAGAILGPESGEGAPPELLIAPAVQPGFAPEPEPIEETEVEQNLSRADTTQPALPEPRDFNPLRDPADIPGPEGLAVTTSFLIDTRQVFEEDQETQALQAPAFPELDPNEPFVPNVEPEAREENIPAVTQAPLNVPPPAVEDVVPVAPPVPGSVAALDENSQALRRDNLGTDPALRSNRELRNFLQEFNNRIEPPEEVTEPAGGPITEVQNNAPPSPAVFENLEAASAELLNNLREQEAREGVTRPEEERTAPPEPRTPESVLTERGQNIDRFI